MGLALILGALLARAGRYTAHGRVSGHGDGPESLHDCLGHVALVSCAGPAGPPEAYWQTVLRDRDRSRRPGSCGGAFRHLHRDGCWHRHPSTSLANRRWKLWMRLELALWWLVLLTGSGIYKIWYTASHQWRQTNKEDDDQA